MFLTLILFLIFVTVGLISYSVIPIIYDRAAVAGVRREQRFSSTIEQLLPRQEAQKIGRIMVLAPIGLAVAAFFLAPEDIRLVAVVVGFVVGLIIPGFYISTLKTKNRKKFGDQLIDALMIMSSSFRGGLSLIQAMEAVVEEMPDPIQKEFATVLGENKMGVSLEDALAHLYSRQTSSALQQMITAILLARETGGNLPVIFTRIVNNIRENKKIQENIDTLTVQGKIQGGVMSLLPVGFLFIVYSSNRRIFDHMLESNVGRIMLFYAFFSWLFGVIMIWRISTFKEY